MARLVERRRPGDLGAMGGRKARALEGLKVLAELGVIRQISPGDYDRQFAADELFDLVEAFEDQLSGMT